jgi:hypothetical protein
VATNLANWQTSWASAANGTIHENLQAFPVSANLPSRGTVATLRKGASDNKCQMGPGKGTFATPIVIGAMVAAQGLSQTSQRTQRKNRLHLLFCVLCELSENRVALHHCLIPYGDVAR